MKINQFTNHLKLGFFKNHPQLALQSVGIYAFILSLLISFSRGVNLNFSQDSKDYISDAENLANGFTWMFNNADQFTKPLGLPFQVLILKVLFGANWLITFKFVSALLHAITAVLVLKICFFIGVRRHLSLLCGLVFASDPLVVISTTDLTTETIATLTITLWFYWALNKLSDEKITLCLKLTLVLFTVLCIATRPNYLFIILSIVFFLIVKKNYKILKSPEIVSISALVGLFQIFVCFLYKGLILIAPGSGLGMYFFCRGNLNQQAIGLLNSERNTTLNNWVLDSLMKQSELFFSQNPDLGFVAFNNFLTSSGLNYCLANPAEGLVSIFLRGVGNWRPFVAFGAYGLSTFILSMLILGTLLAGTIMFLIMLKSRTERMFMQIFLVASAAFTLSILVTPTQIRHRIAFSESLMWICCVILINRVLTKRQQRVSTHE